MKKKAIDKFQLITDKLIALMESGQKPWEKPWHSTPYGNAISGHQYQGINPLLAATDVLLNDYQSPLFVGFSQAKNLGWTIRKGSKSTWLLWGGKVAKDVIDPETGEERTEFYRTCKWLNVFNLDCIDDSAAEVKTADYLEKLHPGQQNFEPRLDRAEQFIAAQNAQISFGGDVACYVPSADKIKSPEFVSFSNAASYYATLIHELSHWTAHPSRLNRPVMNRFGTQAYAFEELVAEISAAFICSEMEIASPLEHHASYLAHWIQLLKSDNRAFIKAASLAQKAANYLFENAGQKEATAA